jgi:hypothetical protein
VRNQIKFILFKIRSTEIGGADSMQNGEEKIVSASAKTVYAVFAFLLIAVLIYGAAQWR